MDLSTLHKLAAQSRTAPIDWRHVLWPDHPTTAIRALITRGYLVPTGGGRLVQLTAAGRRALWSARQAQARTLAIVYGLGWERSENEVPPAQEAGGSRPTAN